MFSISGVSYTHATLYMYCISAFARDRGRGGSERSWKYEKWRPVYGKQLALGSAFHRHTIPFIKHSLRAGDPSHDDRCTGRQFNRIFHHQNMAPVLAQKFWGPKVSY